MLYCIQVDAAVKATDQLTNFSSNPTLYLKWGSSIMVYIKTLTFGL